MASEFADIRSKIFRWIIKKHRGMHYAGPEQEAGGSLLARELVADLFPPAPPEESPRRNATWSATPGSATHLASGISYPIATIEDWYGASWWSSPSRNNQPLPGKVPGDVIELGPGVYRNHRYTLHCDIDVAALALNPERIGDRDGRARPYTYLNEDGTIRYGLNNEFHFKGDWTLPTPPMTNPDEPAYPAWFKAGVDPLTVIRGTIDFDGLLSSVLGNIYIERSSALLFENIRFKDIGTPKGIIMTERPVGRDKDGQPIPDGTNWPENPLCVAGEWQTQRNLHFKNCEVDGQWNAETNAHPAGVGRSKWAVHTNQVGWSEIEGTPGFSWVGGSLRGIGWEHLFYHHNPRAKSKDAIAILISGVEMRWAKRTAIQVVSRDYEGPVGRGQIVIEDCTIDDVCIGQGGQGSALTFAGRLDGHVQVHRVTCRLGSNPNLHPDLRNNITGSFVSYAGGGSDGIPTDEITISGCHFETGLVYKGDRTNVSIANVGKFSLINTSIHTFQGVKSLEIDVDTVDEIVLDSRCEVIGPVVFGSKSYQDPDENGLGWISMLENVANHAKVEILH